jgi:phosphocarrier protein
MILAHGDTVQPHIADQSNGHLRCAVVITNPQGLHLRPATAFVLATRRFSLSNVTVWKGNQSVNGKSLMDLITLGAGKGSELVVEVGGDDAHSALPVLIGILAAPTADDLDGEQGSTAG